MKNTGVLIFCLIIFFFSCKKTNDSRDTNFLEGTYITENNFIAEPSIMYTHNSIITNQQIIQNYFTNHSIVSISAASVNVAFNDTVKVEFLNTTNAKVSFHYLPQASFLNGSSNTSVIESTSSNILLKSTDTTYKIFTNDYCIYNSNPFIKNAGIINCLPFNGGNNFSCTYLSEFPIEIVNNKLRMPFFTILKSRKIVGPVGNSECFSIRSNIYSYFNEMPINQLINNDTVVVKKMYVNLRHI